MRGRARCTLPPSPFEEGLRAGGPVYSDGVRWAAWLAPDMRAVVVFDERGDRMQRFDSRPGCEQIVGVGGDRLLRVCRNDEAPAWQLPELDLVHLPTGIREQMRRPEDASDYYYCHGDDATSPGGVGAHWVAVAVSGYHYHSNCWFNWRTGASEFNSSPQSGQQYVPDLDTPELWRPLCTPLRRRANPYSDPYDSRPPFFDYSFDGTFGLTRGPGPYSEEDGLPGPLLLDRCGTTRTRRLSRCWAACVDASLGGGLVTWSGFYEVHVVNLERERRYTWGAPKGESSAFVVHTRRHVFATRYEDEDRARIFVARVPGG